MTTPEYTLARKRVNGRSIRLRKNIRIITKELDHIALDKYLKLNEGSGRLMKVNSFINMWKQYQTLKTKLQE